MTYAIKPLSCDPSRIKGMSEKLIVSHYENNYGGAVKRLNLIEEQLAELDFNKAPGFLLNGLKREQLIATNSMILHELFFDGLGEKAVRERGWPRRSTATSARSSAGVQSSSPWVRRLAAARAGCCSHGHRATRSSSINGRPTTVTRSRVARRMYEHSYHMDYGAKAASYVDTFMAAIRWSNVDRLFGSLGG
jgi:Fe-Mn family superoxide dismutase